MLAWLKPRMMRDIATVYQILMIKISVWRSLKGKKASVIEFPMSIKRTNASQWLDNGEKDD